jgi:hypothetical protein
MDLGSGLGHLSYSTLVHSGDTWEDLWESLITYVPQVKTRVSPDQPFGLSLRLAAAAVETLVIDRGERERLVAFLETEGLYVYTVNAFVYGGFKGQVVKEQVYEPDWQTEQRVRYTTQVADVLAEISPGEVRPSIQTAPMGFKPKVTGPAVIAEYRANVLRVAAHLVDIERRTGKVITLAIEPEPHCFVETTDDAIEFFEQQLYTGSAARELAGLAALPISEATAALRRHIGVVFDIGHQAVEFEDPVPALQKLIDAGIPVFKLQLAAALRLPTVTAADVERLRRFAGTIYLTQTVERRDGAVRRCLRRLGGRSRATRVANPLPRTDLPPRPRGGGDDSVRNRGCIGSTRSSTAVTPPRGRDIHVGRAPDRAQEWGHRRVRVARARMGSWTALGAQPLNLTLRSL